MNQAETIADVRVAACSAGPVPFRATEAEDILKGNAASGATSSRRRARLCSSARPSPPTREPARRTGAPVLPRGLGARGEGLRRARIGRRTHDELRIGPMMKLSATINGRREQIAVEPLDYLIDALRNGLHLRGTKEGCREGECGTCTVLVDGMPVNSCVYAALAVEGRNVETIEGLQDELITIHPECHRGKPVAFNAATARPVSW